MQGNMGLMVSVEALRDRMWVWVLKRFFWLPSRELLQVEAGRKPGGQGGGGCPTGDRG